MTQVTIAERMRLSALIVGRAVQSVAGGAKSHPLLRWRYTPAGTDRLLVAPVPEPSAAIARAVVAAALRPRRVARD